MMNHQVDKNAAKRLPLLQVGFLIALLLPAKQLVALGEKFGNLTLVLFLYTLALVAAVAWLVLAKKSLARPLFGSFHQHHVLIGVLWGIGVFVLASIGYAINQTVFGLAQPSEIQLFHQTGIAAFLVASIILVGPILEEYIFRGLLLRSLTQKLSNYLAIAVSAGLFSIYHLSSFQLLPIFLLGLGLGTLALRSKSLWPVVIAHLVFNGIGFALFLLFA